MGNFTFFLKRHTNQLIAVLTPIILLPLPFLVTDQKGTCGFMLLLMAVYWCTETLPLGVTGLIPVVLVPLFGINSTKAVCYNYLQDTTMMFVGGIIVALGIENSLLHRRIALTVLKTCGTKSQWLMLGFMLPTWFLSMWISNTATSAMMLPIVEAVLEQLKPSALRKASPEDSGDAAAAAGDVAVVTEYENSVYQNSNGNLPQDIYDKKENKSFRGEVYTSDSFDLNKSSYKLEKEQEALTEMNVASTIESFSIQSSSSDGQEDADYMHFCKGMTLCVCYSANVGGIATLTGTGPNTIMKGHADYLWGDRDLGESPVTYASWIVVGFPIALLCLLIVWMWLQLYFLGIRGTFGCFFKSKGSTVKEEAAKKVILREYENLGPLRFAEAASGLCFVTLVLLWFFRSPGFIDGWASFFEPGFIGDAVPAMLMAIILFIIPMELPKWDKKNGSAKVGTLLTWDVVHKKYPWSVVFLMGGGFALAEACEKSGLSQWIGDQLAVFGSLPGWLMLIIICSLVALLTEVTSNSATCTILMPIMAAMAESLGWNPLYLMFPACLSTSFAFMLPVATPPNAIAFSYGRLKVIDMVKAGALLNFLCVLVVTLATTTWITAYFNLDVLPWDPEDIRNVTTATPVVTCAPFVQ